MPSDQPIQFSINPEDQPLAGPAHTDTAQGSIMGLIHAILEQRKLTAQFQPILNLKSGELLGFEGLIRGPADGPLHLPSSLFNAAKRCGLSLEIEMLCRQIVLECYARLNLPGKLFLNISPEILSDPGFKNGQTIEYMDKLGILPEQVIIEITENQPTEDFQAMRNALLHYRSMGFKIAIDDLGEGFSSLRLWSELRPEFVKIDMHFVQGVNTDPMKLQFLKSIQQIADSAGTHVIAEGIETEAELMIIRDIGIIFGQGYFIARSTAAPLLFISADASRVINSSAIVVYPDNNLLTSRNITAQKLLSPVEPVLPSTPNSRVFSRFMQDTGLHALPVVEQGLPVGLINRYRFIERYTQRFKRLFMAKQACKVVMHEHPLLVDINTPLLEISHTLSKSANQHYLDGFIITEQGRYVGLATGQDLLQAITQMQIEAARYANPLTLLPGNVPINEHTERLLQAATPFYACYCDLDNFKQFNDVYGYRKGDEIIQLTARILSWVCDAKLDFLGHIGGDDFILLKQSVDWERRCQQALESFAQASALLFTEAHRAAGGYTIEDRHGNKVFHPLPSLSIGAVCILPGQFNSHHEVSAAATEAKRMAKRIIGNSLFIEKRGTAQTMQQRDKPGLLQ
ncbi:MAG: GGDEF domain-containing protein [Gallionellaceae bacterium]|nr:GGDEF domain-containing protein [Gallionellaceae bacterium]